jgi:HlyD family secretion protein
MKKKIFISSFAVVALTVAGFLFFGNSKSSKDTELPKVKISRGNIIDKALAVGTIEPENEISVKSKVGGVVKRIFADAGTFINAGDPLLEVKPDPAPQELADAKRGVQLAEVEVENVSKDIAREEAMFKKKMISSKEYEDAQRKSQEGDLHLKIAKENLALLESGRSGDSPDHVPGRDSLNEDGEHGTSSVQGNR